MPFAKLPDAQLYYEWSGPEHAPVLILSNSLGTTHRMWDPQVAAFTRHFRLLRYDTRGHGQSSATPGPYTIEKLGWDVVHLLDYLQLERVDFCGLSMGGSIGIWLGIRAPHRLHRLILCNTAARIGTKEVWNARIATVRKDGMKSVAAAVVERWFTPEFRASSREVVRTQQMLANSPPQGYAACCAAVRDMDERERVARIKVPTLVIYGGRDPVIPIADAHFLADQIAESEKVELDAAHLSNVEQASAFTEAVSNFLSS